VQDGWNSRVVFRSQDSYESSYLSDGKRSGTDNLSAFLHEYNYNRALAIQISLESKGKGIHLVLMHFYLLEAKKQ